MCWYQIQREATLAATVRGIPGPPDLWQDGQAPSRRQYTHTPSITILFADYTIANRKTYMTKASAFTTAQ